MGHTEPITFGSNLGFVRDRRVPYRHTPHRVTRALVANTCERRRARLVSYGSGLHVKPCVSGGCRRAVDSISLPLENGAELMSNKGHVSCTPDCALHKATSRKLHRVQSDLRRWDAAWIEPRPYPPPPHSSPSNPNALNFIFKSPSSFPSLSNSRFFSN